MKPTLFALAVLACASAGCLGHKRSLRRDDCPAEACPAGACPPPRVEFEGPEHVVIQGPRTKIYVEETRNCPPASPPGASAPAASPPPAPSPPAAAPPTVPQPAAGFGMANGMMAAGVPMMPMMPMAAGFGGFGGQTIANAQVRDRTRIGWIFEPITIKLPWIKPVPVNRPADVTFQLNQQQQAGAMGFGVPMMPMSAPVMPVGGFGGGMGFVPQPSIGYGQVTVASQVPVSQITHLQGAVQGGAGLSPAAGPPPAPGAAPPSADALQKQLDECRRKLKELEDKQPEKK